MADMAVFLPRRGKAQMARILMFPREGDILNKFGIWKERQNRDDQFVTIEIIGGDHRDQWR